MAKDVFDIKNGKYQIVYPRYNTSYLVVLQLKRLQLQLKNEGKQIAIVKDNSVSIKKEILIGKTNRSQFCTIDSEDEYIIIPKDNKLIIDGGSVQSIIKALDVLSNLLNGGQFVFTSAIKGVCNKSKSNVCGYRIKKFDDFNGDNLNNMWTPYTRKIRPEKYENKENGLINSCFRSEDNIDVNDGKLFQKILMENQHTLVGAKMTTQKSFWFRYGYTEASLKVASGFGTGSGFWLHGDNTKEDNKYCEFDIVEIYGNPFFNRFSPITWIAKKKGNNSAWYLGEYTRCDTRVSLENGEKFSDEYHTFGLEWDENYYRFIMDGDIIFENKYTDWDNKDRITCYQQPVYAIISINGGNFDWKIVEPDSSEPDFSKNNWKDDNIYTVDYFFVYQKENQVSGKSIQEVLSKIK